MGAIATAALILVAMSLANPLPPGLSDERSATPLEDRSISGVESTHGSVNCDRPARSDWFMDTGKIDLAGAIQSPFRDLEGFDPSKGVPRGPLPIRGKPVRIPDEIAALRRSFFDDMEEENRDDTGSDAASREYADVRAAVEARAVKRRGDFSGLEPEEIVRALPGPEGGLLSLFVRTTVSNVRIESELLKEEYLEVEELPVIGGRAHVHSLRFKCTVEHDETTQSVWPIRFRRTRPVKDIVYVDHDHVISDGSGPTSKIPSPR